MSGFETLPQAIDLTVAMNPQIPEDKVAFAEEELDDTTALGLVLTDTNSALTFLQEKELVPVEVERANDLIRAYIKPRMWPDGKPRANMPMFVILEAIEKIMPTLYMALFGSGNKRPFLCEPLGKTKPEAARAKGSVLYWATKQANLKENMRLTLKTCLSYGFCMGWTGWESKTLRKRVYTKVDNKIKRDWKEVPMNLPTYDNMELNRVFFDPHCNVQNIQDGARFCGKQVMINANILAEMREDTDHYKNIPTDDELRVILSSLSEPTTDTMATQTRAVWREFQAKLKSVSTSMDPLEQPLEYIEYWTKDRVIGVLQRRIVIRNQANEKRKLPGYSCAFVDVLGSAWGFGIARLLSGEQRFQTGVENNFVDSLALVLNPTYQLLKGIGAGTQNISISPGKVVTVNGELKPLVVPDITGPATTAIEASEMRANKRVGANGGSDMPTQAFRTNGGVQTLTGDVVQRLQYFLEIFINNIYLPVLKDFLETCLEHLEPEQINHILSQEEGAAWDGDILDVYTAECSVDVIAGANLMAKQAAAQLAPQFLQTISAGPVAQQLDTQGIYFDFANYMEDTSELLGVDPDEYFKAMTPEMKQVRDARNQAATKAAADSQLQAQKHQDDMELANEKGTVQAGVAIVRKAAETHLDVAQNALENLNSGSGEGQQ